MINDHDILPFPQYMCAREIGL